MTNEQATFVAQAMAALWQSELPATQRVLGAMTDTSRDYKPHDRSRSAWELATHLATADAWFLDSIREGKFVWDAAKMKEVEASLRSVSDVVAFYEQHIPRKLTALLDMPGDALAESVDFFGMMRMPRAQWIGFANNHSVHHRGQLSAYLRSMGCRVPDIYGPSGDSDAPADS